MKKVISICLSVLFLFLFSVSAFADASKYPLLPNSDYARALFGDYLNSEYFDPDIDWVIYSISSNSYELACSVNKDEHIGVSNGYLFSDGECYFITLQRINTSGTQRTYFIRGLDQGVQFYVHDGVILGNIEGSVYPYWVDDLINGYQIRSSLKVSLVFLISTCIFVAMILLFRRFF